MTGRGPQGPPDGSLEPVKSPIRFRALARSAKSRFQEAMAGRHPPTVLCFHSGLVRLSPFERCTLREISALDRPARFRTADWQTMDETEWSGLLDEARSGAYAAVIISMPYATWSRAKGNKFGPRPARSAAQPWGFPWLEGKRAIAVERETPGFAEALRSRRPWTKWEASM